MGKRVINGNNLPNSIKYGSSIADITISKKVGCSPGTYRYVIKFIELKKKTVEKKRFGIFTYFDEVEEKITHTIPFSFNTLELAEDFAKHIPGMEIYGQRLYDYSSKGAIMYETYGISVKGLDTNIYVKFTKNSEHHNRVKKEIYLNDLDRLYFDKKQGNWYNEDELIAERFFTKYTFKYNYENSSIIIYDESISLGELFENEKSDTHKYILTEEIA